MSTQKTGITKRIWLRMLAEGGYWTVPELAQALSVDKRIDGVLSQLAEKGFCQTRDRTDRPNGTKYGVTPTCKIPPEVTLEELKEAGGL